MTTEHASSTGPDLEQGIPASDLAEGAMLVGHVGEEAVLLARSGGEVFAVGATCTHYGGPLGEGLLTGDSVRCPWHHACFSLRTGRPHRAPALKDLPRWRVEERDGRIVLGERIEPGFARTSSRPAAPPRSVVIVGGGAAGESAAETLRREGYEGAITIISADDAPPYDRPNLSKDYLAGTAPEEWIPLHPDSFYQDHDITLVTGRRAMSLDARARRLTLDDGAVHEFGALLLATGATPARLPAAVDPDGRVYYLRTLADSRAIIKAATDGAAHAVVLGASFIGLEVAASLRARGLEVHVVAPDSHPLERVMGPDLSAFIQRIHEDHGVVFHLGLTAQAIDATGATLENGERLPADMVVAGIGVRPDVTLAAEAGLATDNGVLVNEHFETEAPGVFAAGDVARWPDPRTGDAIRIEHWVVAQRQGQAAARNMLGQRVTLQAAPFFWSQHYDAVIDYVGHAPRWDRAELDGDPAGLDCTVSYYGADRLLARATIFRGRESLETEVEMERAIRGLAPGDPVSCV